jgi:hypothetical protein
MIENEKLRLTERDGAAVKMEQLDTDDDAGPSHRSIRPGQAFSLTIAMHMIQIGYPMVESGSSRRQRLSCLLPDEEVSQR